MDLKQALEVLRNLAGSVYRADNSLVIRKLASMELNKLMKGGPGSGRHPEGKSELASMTNEQLVGALKDREQRRLTDVRDAALLSAKMNGYKIRGLSPEEKKQEGYNVGSSMHEFSHPSGRTFHIATDRPDQWIAGMREMENHVARVQEKVTKDGQTKEGENT